MNIKNLRDEELLNLAMMLSEMQDEALYEINRRPMLRHISQPFLVAGELQKGKLKHISHIIYNALGYHLADAFYNAAEDMLGRFIDIFIQRYGGQPRTKQH